MAVRRINDSLLGVPEKSGLAWMAARLPAWVIPNHLTLLGFCGALVTATGFVLSRGSLSWLWLASAGLIANWAGDSLDGTLARLRRIERPRFGFFIDHTCDLFSQSLMFVALGVSPCTHFGVACLGLIAFLMAFVYTLIGLHLQGELRITFFGFGPTEIRALLVLGNGWVLAFGVVDLRPWLAPWSPFEWVSLHDVVISFLAASGGVLIAALAVQRARALNVEDPPRTPSPNRVVR